MVCLKQERLGELFNAIFGCLKKPPQNNTVNNSRVSSFSKTIQLWNMQVFAVHCLRRDTLLVSLQYMVVVDFAVFLMHDNGERIFKGKFSTFLLKQMFLGKCNFQLLNFYTITLLGLTAIKTQGTPSIG